MNTLLRIVSWNIAGARKVQSLDRFEYFEEDVTYFADQLSAVHPDVVCFQETHSNADHSTAVEIAKLLNFPFVYEAVVSPSHIDSSFNLGNTIISKYELDHVEDVIYPYPDFDLYFKDGRPAACHNKMIQIYTFRNLTIANTQMLPLHVFSENYATGNGAKLAEQIDDILSKKLSKPVAICGDFNFNRPQDIYPKTYETLALRDTLPDSLTRPNKDAIKLTPDHIVVSSDVVVHESHIVEVMADHYLCYTDIEISE